LRNLVPGNADLEQPFEGKESETLSYLPTEIGRESGNLSSRCCGVARQQFSWERGNRRTWNDSLSLAASPLSCLPHLCHPGLRRIFRSSADRVDGEWLASGG